MVMGQLLVSDPAKVVVQGLVVMAVLLPLVLVQVVEAVLLPSLVLALLQVVDSVRAVVVVAVADEN
jgi:hypothetical protein